MCLGFLFHLKSPHNPESREAHCGVRLHGLPRESTSDFTDVCLCPGTELVVVPLHRGGLDIPGADDAAFEGAIPSWLWGFLLRAEPWLSCQRPCNFFFSPNLQFSKAVGTFRRLWRGRTSQCRPERHRVSSESVTLDPRVSERWS